MVLELDLAPVIETKSDRLPWCQRASPSTTLYESVKSTDADRLIQEVWLVKKYFGGFEAEKRAIVAEKISTLHEGWRLLDFGSRFHPPHRRVFFFNHEPFFYL